MRKATGLFLIFFLCIIPLHSKYHPEIQWRELRNQKFIVIFPRGYEETANSTLAKAEYLYSGLKEFWGWRIKGKIRIVLSDNTDYETLESTYFPYNQIKISVFPPEPDSIMGNWGNWIGDALRFELNSLFILNSGSSLLYDLRKYLGFNTMFFPAGLIPSWIFKGLAAEDMISGGLNPMFDEIFIERGLKSYLNKQGKFPHINSLKKNFHQWPGKYSDYFFGISFVRYIDKLFGRKSMVKLVKNFSEYPLPGKLEKHRPPVLLTTGKRFFMVFNRKIKDVIAMIEEDNKKNVDVKSPGKFYTNSGYIKKYPTIVTGNSVAYFENMYYASPSLILLDTISGRRKKLVSKTEINGLSYCKRDKKIYFSAIDSFKSFYKTSDIYRVDPVTGKTERLSRGMRLFSPVSYNGKDIYCIQRRKDLSVIVKFNGDSGVIVDISDPSDSYSGLSLSPDGKFLAVASKQDESSWQIALLDIENRSMFHIDTVGIKDFSPHWTNNRELVFLSEGVKNVSFLKLDTEDMSLVRLDNSGVEDIRYFDVDINGKIVFSALNKKGFDIGTIGMGAPGYCSKVVPIMKGVGVKTDRNTLNKRIKFYDPFRDFLPQYFTLSFRMGGNEIQPGLIASGFDSIMKHYYKVKIMRGFASRSWNTYFNYLYDENFGTFGFKYTNYFDLNRSESGGRYFRKREKVRFSFFYPLLTSFKGNVFFYSDLHFENESEYGERDGNYGKEHFNGIRAGISFDSTREYYDSISPSDGIKMTASYSREFKRLGSESDINTAALEFRMFIPVINLNRLAMRFVVANSWGEGQKKFFMGGVHRNDGIEYAGENHFDLMRGFPSGYFQGNGGYLFNLEYRMLLKRVERSFLVIKSVDKIYLSVFSDAGRIWNGFDTGDTAVSLGGELNIIAFIGRYRYTLTLGFGKGINPVRKPAMYVRIGNSF